MYGIYTGYSKDVNPQKYGGLASDDFFNVWLKNTRENSSAPVFVVGPDKPPAFPQYWYGRVKVLDTYPNHGPSENDGKALSGWTTGVLAGLLHAYLHKHDMIYKEQDCLWYGDPIGELYKQIENAGIIYGKNKMFGHANSLFLVKHSYIPYMIHHITDPEKVSRLPEHTFRDLKNSRQFSFGYDRDRPFRNDATWYVQQVSPAEWPLLPNY